MMRSNNVMRSAKAGIFIIPLLFILIGCSDEFVGPTATGVIMPLKVGNQWIGRWTEYDDAGAVIATTYDTLTIESQVRRDEEIWYLGSNGKLYINHPNGLYKDSSESSVCGCYMMLAKYPSAVGDTFNTQRHEMLLQGETWVRIDADILLAKDSAITTPAGTYSCYVYGQKLFAPLNAGLLGWEWKYYAPNVGLVKKEIGSYGRVEKSWELVKLRLG